MGSAVGEIEGSCVDGTSVGAFVEITGALVTVIGALVMGENVGFSGVGGRLLTTTVAGAGVTGDCKYPEGQFVGFGVVGNVNGGGVGCLLGVFIALACF